MKKATKQVASTAKQVAEKPVADTVKQVAVMQQLEWATSLSEILRSRTAADSVDRQVADKLLEALLSVTEQVDSLSVA